MKGLLKTSRLLKEIDQQNIPIIERALDLESYQDFSVFDEIKKIALPVTFTPYASVKPCSARCWFCSENLKTNNSYQRAASLRPTIKYQEQLEKTLRGLTQIPLGLSLSGLEMTDDIEWLIATLDTLSNWCKFGGNWQEKAAYTNAAGFADIHHRKNLITKLSAFEFDRFEISRHHFDSLINQDIMNFRDSELIRHSEIFESVIKELNDKLPISLVCIIQRDGINSLESIEQYLSWANKLGIKKIIFRELCDVSTSLNKNDDANIIYKENKTYKNILNSRICIEKLVSVWLSKANASINHFTNGYYFWNADFNFCGMNVIFERSDYAMMNTNHQSDVIHKLVFFANGNLCTGWEPDNNIINSSLYSR